MLEAIVNQSRLLPNDSKLLILGGGFSGQHVAKAAKALGVEVYCTRRSLDKPGADLIFDSCNKEIKLPEDLVNHVTHLISCIPPTESGADPVLKSIYTQIKKMPLRWAGYMSTTGIYGDCKGAWVKESDEPNPQQARSQRRLSCEKAWQSSGLPVQILRLPGIYGPGRSAIEIVKKEKSKMVDKPNQVFSRVHIDDIAGAIFHLINLSEEGNRPPVINIADNLPTSNVEVLTYAASLLNKPLPPIEKFEIASQEMSDMALSFWQENRRVNNDLLCKKLGYVLIHPNFKSGLQDCLKSEKRVTSTNVSLND